MSRRPRTQQQNATQHELGHDRPMGYIEARIAEGNSPAIQQLEQIENRLTRINQERTRRAHLMLQQPIVTGNPELNSRIAEDITSPIQSLNRAREMSQDVSRELSEFSRQMRGLFSDAPIMRGEIDASEFDRNPALLDFDIREIVNNRAMGNAQLRIMPQAVVSELFEESKNNSIRGLKQVSLLDHLSKHIAELTKDPTYSLRDCFAVENLLEHISSVCTKKDMTLCDVITELRDKLRRMEKPRQKPDVNRVDLEL